MMKLLRISKIVLFNTALLVLLCLLAEGVYRLSRPDYKIKVRTYPGQYDDKDFPQYSWAQKDSDLGWVLNSSKVVHDGWGIPYKANKQGFRDGKDFDNVDIDSGKKRVMILGDSFTCGMYIRQDATIPALIQKKLGADYEVYNLGMLGWGIDQMYTAYKKYEPVIKPQVVILVYIDDDLYRSFEAFARPTNMNKPSYDVRNGKLVLRTGRQMSFLERMAYSSHLLNRTYFKFEKYYCRLIARAILTDMMDDTSRKNIEFFVVRIPLLEQVQKNDRRSAKRRNYFDFSALFVGKKAQYLQAYDSMIRLAPDDLKSLYFDKDLHMSESGDEFMADYITTRCILPKK